MAASPTALTAGMVYLETSEGIQRGRRTHRRVALQLVEIARLADGEVVRGRLEIVTASAMSVGERWAVVVHRDYHHAACVAKRKLRAILRE
jgi:hypothetical protein